MSTSFIVGSVAGWLVYLEVRLAIMRKQLRDHERSVGHEWARGVQAAAKAHRYADFVRKLYS